MSDTLHQGLFQASLQTMDVLTSFSLYILDIQDGHSFKDFLKIQQLVLIAVQPTITININIMTISWAFSLILTEFRGWYCEYLHFKDQETNEINNLCYNLILLSQFMIGLGFKHSFFTLTSPLFSSGHAHLSKTKSGI